MRFNYFVPSKYQQFVNTCLRIFNSKTPGIVFFAPKTDRVRRVDQLIENNKSYFSIIKLQFISQEINDVDDLEALLNNELRKIKDKKSIGIFIINPELLISEKKYFLLDHIVKKQEKNPNLNFIFLSEIDLVHPEIAKNFSKSSLFSNIYYYSLYQTIDIIEFVKYLEKKWDFKLKSNIKKKIIKQCNGHLWLIKQAVKIAKDNPNLKIEQIFNKEEIQIPLGLIASSFLESELSIVYKILQKKQFTSHLEKHSLSYLKKIGLVVNNQITIPLLEDYLRESIPKVNIRLLGRHISMNDLIIDNYFSKKEIRALRILLEKRKEIVCRDILAKAIWPIETEKHYSDWAIDRLISRLKEKIYSLGLAKKMIKTVRGQGYMFID